MMNRNNIKKVLCLTTLLTFFASMDVSIIDAKDTDVYQINVKQNAYILLDNSGSMAYGVYEHNIDYGAMFDYLFTLNDDPVGDYKDYIYDTVNNSSYFYQNHYPANKIYLAPGNIGVTIATVDGEDVAFTGDAADPDYLWYSSQMIDTHTIIDLDGNLAHDGSGSAQRVTVDGEGHILLDAVRLPLGQDITLHDMQTLYDGSQIDNGFGGLVNAPGYMFSGYENGTLGSLDIAESGDTKVVYFITGNWMNMQAMYNLHYKVNPPGAASSGDSAWIWETFPISADAWSPVAYVAQYPSSGVYSNNLDYNTSPPNPTETIVHAGAKQIQVHFSSFDVESKGASSCYDYIGLFDASDNLASQYCTNTLSADGWSGTILGDTVKIKINTDGSVVGNGYVVDKIRVTYVLDSYLMQNRLDVAKDALTYAVDEFAGKIDWGYTSFKYTGSGSGDGATLQAALQSSDNAIKVAIENTDTKYGTPLGEALQDVWYKGYWGKRSSLSNSNCRKNYVITVTDGFPSSDNEWDRIGAAGGPQQTITDIDSDGWTSDPYQGSVIPNYYDDVGRFMYTHDWQDDDMGVISDPANSYNNVITHNIAFGARHPLMEEAAGDSGGNYITAYNKTQLVSAFYALALQISEAVSFTAPVVSVDAKNKIQSGDDLFLGLFLPKDNKSWVGNIKKFKLGDGSTDRPDLWTIYDGANNPAVDSSGKFKDNTSAFWDDDFDQNDSDNYGAADVTEDGVGEVLRKRVDQNFIDGATTTSDYYDRKIYTYLGGAMTSFESANVTFSNLNVGDDATRNALINYVYGYTNDQVAGTGAPVAVRDWVLGSIVHSRLTVIDYYDPNDISILLKRYIVVGANDGMLHVFDDANGKEIFAFIPPDLLTKLSLLPVNNFVEMVDGDVTLFRRDKKPKYIIFGERRGGKYYYCLDVSDSNPLNWSYKWSYTNPQIKESWGTPVISKVPVSITGTGRITYKDVVVFSGGYDNEEDDFPEPFNDEDGSGSPFKANGDIDGTEWDKNDDTQDVPSGTNNVYDISNPGMNEFGRGVYVVDVDDPTNTSTGVLPFSVSYDATPLTTGTAQKLDTMIYCIPATPTLVEGAVKSYFYNGSKLESHIETNVLESMYFNDIYSNTYRVNFDFPITLVKDSTNPGDQAMWAWSATKTWYSRKVFSVNQGSDNASGTFGGSDGSDPKMKSFYSPEVAWGGAGLYFDKGNYPYQNNTTFYGTDRIASLYFGTGDREHPFSTMVRNRMYGVYDDISVYGLNGSTVVNVSGSPYTENDLMNLTCGEFDPGITINSGATVAQLDEWLVDDATYESSGNLLFEEVTNENDAKGWYIILADQGDSTACGHIDYPTTIENTTITDHDNHYGEKILSKPVLFAGIVYFTSYQSSAVDPCNPLGNGFTYALNYDDASSAYDLNGDGIIDITDRYMKFTDIYGIPSGFAVIIRNGQAGAMAMMGSRLVGPGPGGDGGGFKIKSPGLGLELYYWRGSNSKKGN